MNGGGQLVGINSSIATLGSGGAPSGNIGIGFAIPVNESKSVAEQLITTGKAVHGFLGVTARAAIVVDGPAKRPAAAIIDVGSGTPAEQAGLKVGDAIIAVDGETIDGALSLIAQVRERTAGNKITSRFSVTAGPGRSTSSSPADRAGSAEGKPNLRGRGSLQLSGAARGLVFPGRSGVSSRWVRRERGSAPGRPPLAGSGRGGRQAPVSGVR